MSIKASRNARPLEWGCEVDMPKLTDLPPVWLALGLCLVWGLDQLVPWSLFGPGGRPVGALLIFTGLGLVLLAAAQMIRHRTTVIPKNDPSHLMTTGLFRLSRNPIYLGDAMILAGAILWWDVPHGVPVLIGFMALIQHRFILDEEDRLRAAFGDAFERWASRTGRWISLPGK
ncbi:methyltransferase family protein [Thioclava sp. FR2]|uniref:methyltransferase family protein n=1 Tax=Thioclava sp. FR2 TaxID=3445780 RepID=UPI003EBD32E6